MMNFKEVISAIIACLLWSTAFAGIKIGLQYCTPLPFAGIRFMLSGLFLLPFWVFKKKAFQRIKKNWKLIISVSLFQTYILYALMFWAMTYISGAITAIIVGSSPLITAISTHFLTKNDKLSRRKLISIITGIIGIIIITLNKQDFGSGNYYIIGIILLIISMISSALGNIIVSNRKQLISPIALNSLQMILGGISLFITGLFIYGKPDIPVNIEFYLALFWLSFLSATAFSIWFILLKTKNVKVSELNLWKFIIPVFGAVFSWIIIPGEHPETVTIIGMLIAAGSVLMYNLTTNKNK